MNFNNEFVMQNNARILSSFKFQPRYFPVRKEAEGNETQGHSEEIKLSADERRFLLCAFTYLYKKTLTEIYSIIAFSASKGTRITKKLEREMMIRIFCIVRGKGVSKYPVLLQDSYKLLDLEERKFEGKGCGYEHLIWQHILAGHFKECKPVIELNRGNKCIDVAFEYQGKLVAIEVAMTSAHEQANIEKDVQLARADLVIVGCKDEKILQEVNAVIQGLDAELKNRAKAFLLSKILSMNLEELMRQ
jgi:very-short-patch-repair endonuclease